MSLKTGGDPCVNAFVIALLVSIALHFTINVAFIMAETAIAPQKLIELLFNYVRKHWLKKESVTSMNMKTAHEWLCIRYI
jgi:hypothetical protein